MVNKVMSQLVHSQDVYQDLAMNTDGKTVAEGATNIITISLVELLLRLPTKKGDDELDIEEVVNETIAIVEDKLREEMYPLGPEPEDNEVEEENEEVLAEEEEFFYTELTGDFLTDVLTANDYDMLMTLSDTIKDLASKNELEYGSKIVEGGVLLSWKVGADA